MLAVIKLDAGYGPTRVLHQVSLNVAEGEVLAVCGPNGAGKSTLLRVLAGQVRAGRGDVTLRERSIRKASPASIVADGMVLCPEGRQVFTRMTVEENLRLGAYTRGDRSGVQRDIDAYLERWPVIARRRKQPAGLLSGGEQQILAIGRALMSNPAVLLLDEPSLGLAPVLIDQVYEELKSVVDERGLSVLLVEQNVIKALELCDRIDVLAEGRLVYSARADETDSDRVGSHYFHSASGEEQR